MITACEFENMGRTEERANSLPSTHPRRLTVNTLPIPKNIARLPYAERLEHYITRLPDAPGCWLWIGALSSDGYGKIYHNKKLLRAHRAVYEFYRGPIPSHLDACHRCDTPSCVNPEHIFIGTAKDNIQDAMRKGRLVFPRRGEIGTCHRGHVYRRSGHGCRRCGREKEFADRNGLPWTKANGVGGDYKTLKYTFPRKKREIKTA